MPELEKKQKKKDKKRKKKQRESEKGDDFQPGEVEATKGVYFDHQVKPGAIFCTDRKGDPENRIFQRIYNGELPVYKKINKIPLGGHWKPKDSKKKHKKRESRYYAKENRKIIKSAPAATARAVKNRYYSRKRFFDSFSVFSYFFLEK